MYRRQPRPKAGRLRRTARLGRSVLKAQSPFSVGPTQGPQKMYAVRVLGIDGVWRDHRVFANRADAQRSVIRFEAEGFRAKVYRTAVRPNNEDTNVQGDRHRRQVNAAG